MNEILCKSEPRLTLGLLLEDQKRFLQTLEELVDYASKTVSNIAGAVEYPVPRLIEDEDVFSPIIQKMQNVNYQNQHLLGCLTNIIHKIAE